ncbi:MAG: helix-turn-helix domain-containing protein, partial [Chloroflexi bacterium]|nr:helix-turn-helix domain-containing protein [Chloroflexota bacterium]
MTDLISTQEAAEVVGCSIHTILKYARTGAIPHTRTPFKQGRGYRLVYDRADIEAFARHWKNGGTQKHRKAPVATRLPGGFVNAAYLARQMDIPPQTIYTAAKNTDMRTKKHGQRLYVHEAARRALLDGRDPEQVNPADWSCFGYDGSKPLFSGTLDECIAWRDSPDAPEYVRIIRCEQNDLITAMIE